MPGLRSIHALAAAILLCGTAFGQVPTGAVGKGDFPALQLLPPGSVLKGISLPRYENHRVTSLFTAGQMEVRSNNLVVLKNLRVYVYDQSGTTIEVGTDEVVGDFSKSRLVAPGVVSISSPKLEGTGAGAVFSQTSSIGIIKGPVRTSFSTSLPQTESAAKKK